MNIFLVIDEKHSDLTAAQRELQNEYKEVYLGIFVDQGFTTSY